MRWLETKDIRSPENDRRFIRALRRLAALGYSVQCHRDGSVGVYVRSSVPGEAVAVAARPQLLPDVAARLRPAVKE